MGLALVSFGAYLHFVWVEANYGGPGIRVISFSAFHVVLMFFRGLVNFDNPLPVSKHGEHFQQNYAPAMLRCDAITDLHD